MFSPSAPVAVLVFRVPFPWRMVRLSMPVPLMPSVRLATNSHWEEVQSAGEEGQLVDELTTWHTGRVISVTWRNREINKKVRSVMSLFTKMNLEKNQNRIFSLINFKSYQ